jgi:hypothetical protein
MTLARLQTRLTKVQAQWRPWVVEDVLRRARQGAPSEVGAFLRAEVTAVDRATAVAIMQQLTDAEWDALVGPELLAFVETLPASEMEALAHGDPGVFQRVSQSYQRWRKGRHRPMAPCPRMAPCKDIPADARTP